MPARNTIAGSPRPTLGVEWEFALVDLDTRDLSNEAAAVIADIGDALFASSDLVIHRQILGALAGAGPVYGAQDLEQLLLVMEPAMRQAGLPLYSLETHHVLRDFDMVGISLPYEQLYSNVLTLLDLAGVPITASVDGASVGDGFSTKSSTRCSP